MKLSLEGVTARHPSARADAQPVLGPLDLVIDSGEQVAVIGPSGAGKTTLLQVLACALPPSGGALTLDAQAPWTLSTAALQRLRGTLFLAPQVPPLPPRQRVVTAVLAGRLPAIGFFASLRSLLYPADIPAAHAALARFDLDDKLFDRVDRLSGGERQRVGLARALVAPARAWLVDEPLAALDPTHAEEALAAITAQARERGVTLVCTLHQVDAALAHFPRIVGMRDGQLLFDLPAAQVTRERLAQLYARHEAELDGGAAPPRAAVPALDTASTAPVAMHCR
jgi:phosphonate transport system ATP-binding protein